MRGVLAVAIACGACNAFAHHPPTTDPADAPLVSISGDSGDAPGCPSYPANTYTPYSASGTFPRGSVADFPWHGPDGGYPNGDENFSAYRAGEMVECSDKQSARSYLDVTDGCLQAISSSGAMRGSVQATSDGYYRAVALGFTAGDADHPIRWTDLDVSYRFFYTKQTGNISEPGFKIFARYNTEDDLYVGSWRMDDVAQIQRKLCGTYTPLVVDYHFGAPTPNAWHTIELKVVGTELDLILDGKLAVTVSDDTFKSGTAGMRIDSMNGAELDDWRVAAP